MRKKIILLAIALVLSLGTAMLVKQRMNSATASTDDDHPNLNRVLVASQNLSEGTFIRIDKHVQWVEWPTDRIHKQYVREGMIDLQEYNGAVVRQPLLEGEPIVLSGVVKPEDRSFMAAVLMPGYRAISLAVNAISGNAGFVFPGDHVDLILTHRVQVESGEEATVSETFLQDVRVLAMDQRFNSQSQEVQLARTVTLEVTGRQAEMVNVATELGKISLSLRSLGKEEDGPKATTASKLTRDSDVSRLLRFNRYKQASGRVSVSQGGELREIKLH